MGEITLTMTEKERAHLLAALNLGINTAATVSGSCEIYRALTVLCSIRNRLEVAK